jgi:predicted dinucleotide-binding enzyme
LESSAPADSDRRWRGPPCAPAALSSSPTAAAQASAAGIVVIAVPWARVPEAVQGLEWNGQIVIDATNDFAPSDLDGRTSSERVAGLVGGEIRQLRGPLAGINLIRLP